jgi:DNA-binding NarL/FixJ family response regulator
MGSMTQDDPDALEDRDAVIPVLVADDSDVVRRGIRQLLATQVEIAIVGEATNFAQTIQMATELHPRVIVMDLHMPDEKAIAPEELKSGLINNFQVVAISVWNDEETKDLARSLGASALLDKMNLASTLVPTIMRLEHGRAAA